MVRFVKGQIICRLTNNLSYCQFSRRVCVLIGKNTRNIWSAFFHKTRSLPGKSLCCHKRRGAKQQTYLQNGYSNSRIRREKWAVVFISSLLTFKLVCKKPCILLPFFPVWSVYLFQEGKTAVPLPGIWWSLLIPNCGPSASISFRSLYWPC